MIKIHVQAEVLAGPAIEGLTPEMFQRPVNLHITLNLMSLLNDLDMERAENILHDCVENVIAISNCPNT